MMQKVVVGLLILTVVGAVVIGIYDASRSENPVGATELLMTDNVAVATPTQAVQATVDQAPAVQTVTGTNEPIQQQQALAQVGAVWQDSGMITGFDTNGMFLTGTLAGEIYVELGPQNYWQTQPVALAIGEKVSVSGFFNGDQYHAATVVKADGTQLMVRTAEGLPLWSGGNQNGNEGQAQNQNQQGQTGQTQAAPIEWITIEGMVTTINSSILTMQTTSGEILDLQLGQRNFVDSQGIVFNAGDAVTVVGYWQAEQFKAGEITKTATGERLMLLDPNGRPLWGGPGRNTEQSQSQAVNGNSGNSGNGASGNSGNSGNGNSQNGGRGYRGGRNQTETEQP